MAPAAVEYLPVPHSVHTMETTDTANLPASQEVQADDPAPAAYWPKRQSKHVAPDVALVAAEYLPVAQLLAHVAAPEAPENLPAGQPRQVDSDVAPESGEYLPGAHAVQKSADDAHRAPRYVPGRQFEQAEAPVAAANVPASHAKQAEREAPEVAE